MFQEELTTLLMKTRAVLDRYMFEGEVGIRDDVAEICMAIDDLLPEAKSAAQLRAVDHESAPLRVDRSAA